MKVLTELSLTIVRRAGLGEAVRHLLPTHACPALRGIPGGLPDHSVKIIFWIGHLILLFLLLSLPYLAKEVAP
jgi:hypothetical protein